MKDGEAVASFNNDVSRWSEVAAFARDNFYTVEDFGPRIQLYSELNATQLENTDELWSGRVVIQ